MKEKILFIRKFPRLKLLVVSLILELEVLYSGFSTKMSHLQFLTYFIIIGLHTAFGADLKCNFKEEECYNFTTGNSKQCVTCIVKNEVVNDKLSNFDLSGNEKTLKDIIRIQIQSSNITNVPTNLIEVFPELQYIYIFENEGIKTLSPEILKNGDKLNQFWGYQNGLTEVLENTFQGAPNLEAIGLQSNKIRTIHKNAFTGLTKLEVLYFHENLVSDLDPDTFKDNLKLRFVSFAKNELVVVSYSTFSHLKKIHDLLLTDNVCINEAFHDVDGRLKGELDRLCNESTNSKEIEQNYQKLLAKLEKSNHMRKVLEVELLKTKNEIYNLEKFCKTQVKKFDLFTKKNCF